MTGYRRIRVLNGAWAILQIIRNQPFRCIFVGEMPMYLNGGRVPTVLDLIIIPQSGSQNPPNIKNLLCQYRSTQFHFSLDHNQLKYVDLAGGIPAPKQNWCTVRTTTLLGPPPSQFDLDNVVEIHGIPTLHIFALFTDTLQDLLSRYNHFLQTGSNQRGESWPTKSQIKKIRTVIEPLSRKSVVPQNLDQGRAALALSKQLLAILSEVTPTSVTRHQLADCLRRVHGKIENWVNTRHGDKEPTPVPQDDVDHCTEPSVGEDFNECDDWVEVTGVVETQVSYSDHCGEEVLDFELLSVD